MRAALRSMTNSKGGRSRKEREEEGRWPVSIKAARSRFKANSRERSRILGIPVPRSGRGRRKNEGRREWDFAVSNPSLCPWRGGVERGMSQPVDRGGAGEATGPRRETCGVLSVAARVSDYAPNLVWEALCVGAN